MAIDPISGAVIAEPGIAPDSATAVSRFIDQIGAGLTGVFQTWATPTPPSGATYAPSLLGGGTLPLLLLVGGGLYFLTRTSRRSYGRNPTRRFTVKRLASPRAFDRRSFRTVRLPGGRLLTVGCPKGHWGPHSQRCAVGTRGQRIMTLKHHSNPGSSTTMWWVLGAGLVYFMMRPASPVRISALNRPHPYVVSAGHAIFN